MKPECYFLRNHFLHLQLSFQLAHVLPRNNHFLVVRKRCLKPTRYRWTDIFDFVRIQNHGFAASKKHRVSTQFLKLVKLLLALKYRLLAIQERLSLHNLKIKYIAELYSIHLFIRCCVNSKLTRRHRTNYIHPFCFFIVTTNDYFFLIFDRNLLYR